MLVDDGPADEIFESLSHYCLEVVILTGDGNL